MKTVHINVYTFDELSPKAKEKVLEKHRYWNVSDIPWWEGIYEIWTTKLEALGFEDVDIRFSGFYSQGDGASFTASVDLYEWMVRHGDEYKADLERAEREGDIDALKDSTVSLIRSNPHYVHEKTVRAELDDVYSQDFNRSDGEERIASIVEDIELEAQDLAVQIFANLDQQHEYLTSDEAVAESLIANEIEFLSDGTTWTG